MSVRPVDMNGMIQRTQDVGNLKQQEDSKPQIQQHTIEIRQQKQEEQLARQVQHSQEKENKGFRYDAKEKGSNSYEGSGKKKKNQKKELPEDGKVTVKSRNGSFDMKI